MKLTELNKTQLSESTHSWIDELDNRYPEDDVAFIENGRATIVFAYDKGTSQAEFSQMFNSKGYQSGRDYELAIAMGDDDPHAIVVNNLRMLDDPDFQRWAMQIAGPMEEPDEFDD